MQRRQRPGNRTKARSDAKRTKTAAAAELGVFCSASKPLTRFFGTQCRTSFLFRKLLTVWCVFHVFNLHLRSILKLEVRHITAGRSPKRRMPANLIGCFSCATYGVSRQTIRSCLLLQNLSSKDAGS